MKKILFPVLLACCSALNAAEDCAKNADACSAGNKTIVSPFLAASAQAQKAAPAPVPAVKKPSLSVQPVQQVAVSTAVVPPAVPVSSQAGPRSVSSPLWLLLVGAGLVGLYFYLGGKSKKGKRR